MKKEAKMKRMSLLGHVNKIKFTEQILGRLRRSSPAGYNIFKWFLNRFPLVKARLLVDFISETNGMTVIKTKWSNVDGETVTMESTGLTLDRLELKKVKE